MHAFIEKQKEDKNPRKPKWKTSEKNCLKYLIKTKEGYNNTVIIHFY